MALMHREVFDAFKSVGVDDERATKAAEAISSYEGRFAKVEARLDVLAWMVGTNIALSVGILIKEFFR
jgi:hypothetical protein